MYQVMTLLFWNGCAIMISVHVDRNFHVLYSCVVIIFMMFRGCFHFDISVYIMLWLYLYMSWLYMYVLWMYIHVVIVYVRVVDVYTCCGCIFCTVIICYGISWLRYVVMLSESWHQGKQKLLQLLRL